MPFNRYGVVMKNLLMSATVCVALSGMALSSAMAAESCSKQSPAYRVALLELYTSEGCSSCPPADKFVSGLRASGVTPEQAVFLSMHVDYWDDIGWKDVFSKHVITERQRWLSGLAGAKTIYTPEIFMGGQELRGWSDGVQGAVKRINAKPAQADITISLGKLAGNSLPVEINAKAAQGGKLFVALVENGLATDIKAGENSGRVLKHDFVVREWVGPITLTADAKQNREVFARALTVPAGAVAKNLGVTAFVQSDKGEVLQALALPICGS
jgi:hypothetical protein